MKRKKPDGDVSRRGFFKAMGVVGAAAGIDQDEILAKPAPRDLQQGGVGPGAVPVTLRVNGAAVKVKVEPRVTLLDALRDHFKIDTTDPVDLTGSKRACDRNTCGSCTVLIDGKTAYACGLFAVAAQGKEIRTIEGLDKGGKLHPVQEEFIACDGMMCGFCTPGFVMSGVACLEKKPNSTRDEIRKALDGNICRCGTQTRALEAVEKAAQRMKGR